MSQTTLTIGNKAVFVSEPYRAAAAPLVGRRAELELITAAWIAGKHGLPLSPLLLGEPGVGKNRLVYELARRTGKDLYIFQGHEDATAEDLACAVRFSDDPGRKMDYVVSPLVTAMALGGIGFVDEIGKVRPRALALLVSVLDDRRYIDSTLLGARVAAHPGFRFIAATNTADLEGNALPEFIRSRLRPVVAVGYPPREELDELVRSRYPSLQAQCGPLSDCFWDLWRRGGADAPPTPRDVVHVFDPALSLADFEVLDRRDPFYAGGGTAVAASGRPFPLHEGGVATAVECRQLEQAFHELFRRGLATPAADGRPGGAA